MGIGPTGQTWGFFKPGQDVLGSSVAHRWPVQVDWGPHGEACLRSRPRREGASAWLPSSGSARTAPHLFPENRLCERRPPSRLALISCTFAVMNLDYKHSPVTGPRPDQRGGRREGTRRCVTPTAGSGRRPPGRGRGPLALSAPPRAPRRTRPLASPANREQEASSCADSQRGRAFPLRSNSRNSIWTLDVRAFEPL